MEIRDWKDFDVAVSAGREAVRRALEGGDPDLLSRLGMKPAHAEERRVPDPAAAVA